MKVPVVKETLFQFRAKKMKRRDETKIYFNNSRSKSWRLEETYHDWTYPVVLKTVINGGK